MIAVYIQLYLFIQTLLYGLFKHCFLHELLSPLASVCNGSLQRWLRCWRTQQVNSGWVSKFLLIPVQCLSADLNSLNFAFPETVYSLSCFLRLVESALWIVLCVCQTSSPAKSCFFPGWVTSYCVISIPFQLSAVISVIYYKILLVPLWVSAIEGAGFTWRLLGPQGPHLIPCDTTPRSRCGQGSQWCHSSCGTPGGGVDAILLAALVLTEFFLILLTFGLW